MAETTLDMPEVDTTEISLDGDMEIPSSEKLDPTDGQPSTLDEPVSTTIVCVSLFLNCICVNSAAYHLHYCQ